MVSDGFKRATNKILGVIKPAIETAFTKVMLELLQEQYPTKNLLSCQQKGLVFLLTSILIYF